MANEVSVLIRFVVDRLYDGKKWASVVVIPQVVSAEPPVDDEVPAIVKELARPWRWNGNTLVFGTTKGAITGSVSDTRKLKSPKSTSAAALAADHLNKLFTNIKEDNLTNHIRLFDPPPELGQKDHVGLDYGANSGASSDKYSSARISWAAVLNNAVYLPGGIAHLLNLVHIVELPQGANLTLPSIRVTVNESPFLFEPASASPPDSLGFTAYTTTTENLSVTVKGRIESVESAPAADSGDADIDARTYWINLPAGKECSTGRDWFSRLHLDAAQAAFLPSHFADTLQNLAIEDDEKSGDRILPPVVVSLKDTSSIGATYALLLALLQGTLSTGHGKGVFPLPDQPPPGQPAQPDQTNTIAPAPSAWTSFSVRAQLEPKLPPPRVNEVWEALPTFLGELSIATAVMHVLSEAAKSNAGSRLVAEKFWYGLSQYWQKKPGAGDPTTPQGQFLKDFSHQNGEPAPLTSWRDIAENLRDVLLIIGSPEGAADLVLQIWFGPPPLPPGDPLRNLIREILVEMPVFRRLTLDRLPNLWPSFSDVENRAAIEQLADERLSLAEEKTRKAFESGWGGANLPASVLSVRKHVLAFISKRFADISGTVDLGSDYQEKVKALFKAFDKSVADKLVSAATIVGHEPEGSVAEPNPPGLELGSDEPVEAPHPLTFTVGNVMPNALGSKSSGDLQARFGGVGVLIRKFGTDDWYCPTLGAVSVPPAIAGDTWPQPFVWGHSPWRIITQSGLESWTVSYSGLPITARPIISQMTGKTELDEREAASKNILQSFFIIQQILPPDAAIADPPAVPEKWKQIPALAYGRTYKFAFFAPTFAGALPAELCDSTDPTAFTLPTSNVPTGSIVSVRYLRRTGVGAPRLVGHGPKDKTVNLPPIPRGGDWPVAPLAEDMAARESDAWSLSEPIGHLVLLVPKGGAAWQKSALNNFTCGVIPPSVSVEDFCRWRLRDLDFDGDPIKIHDEIASILRATAKSIGDRSDEKKDEQRDPDDLAVTAFLLEITSKDAQGKKTDTTMLVIDVPKPTNSNDDNLERWQAPAVEIEVQAHEPGAKPFDPDPKIAPGAKAHYETNKSGGGKLKSDKSDASSFCRVDSTSNLKSVRLKLGAVSGTIYRIEIFSLVEMQFFDGYKDPEKPARFRSNKLTGRVGGKGDKRVDARAHDNRWYKMASSVITVEVAQAFQKADAIVKDLWQQLVVKQSSPNELVVSINNLGTDPKKDWNFPLARRASISRQLWSWSGRTYSKSIAAGTRKLPKLDIQGFLTQPDLAPEGKWKEFVEHDGQWFGDRADYDSIIVSGVLRPPFKATAKKPSALPSGPQHTIEFLRDRRAQYWRHSAMIENRYVGLMTEVARVGEAGRIRAPWCRLIVKAHPAEQLPKPKLRFILPLTQPMHDDKRPDEQALSTLLVVLEEQWGEVAGFAEILVAEVVEWKDPSIENGERSGLHEIGYDPILTNDTFTMPSPGQAVEIVGQSHEADDGESPLGLVFDARIERPRPASSCFELRVSMSAAERNKLGPQQDIMAKVRLRRELVPNLFEPKDGNFASDWTTPEWVIFNADSRKWRVKSAAGSPKTILASELRLSAKFQIALKDEKDGVEVKPLFENADSTMVRKIYVLLTSVVLDADGRKGERFETIGELEPGKTRPAYWGTPKGNRLKARLVEVEIHSSHNASPVPPDDGMPDDGTKHVLWTWLFPGEGTDAIARIRRVSPPIEMQET